MIRKDSENGITLIALIVTIVVLLILASISIAILTGDNGIISKAKKAREETIIADEKEGVSIGYSIGYINCLNKKTNGNVKAEELEEKMKSDGRDVTVTEDGNDLNVKYTETGHEYTVNQEGDVKEKDNDRIINAYLAISYSNGRGMIVEKESGKVYFLDEIFNSTNSQQQGYNSENWRKVDISNAELISKAGIKNVEYIAKEGDDGYDVIYGFIDKDAKAYLMSQQKFLCINDIKGSELKNKKIIDTDISLNDDDYLVYSVIDENGNIYYYSPFKNEMEIKYGVKINISKPYCVSNKKITKGTNNINELYGIKVIDSKNGICIDENGKVYNKITCLSNIGTDILHGKNIVKILNNDKSSDYVAIIDDQGQIYMMGNNDYGQLGNGDNTMKYSSDFICANDVDGSELKNKKIKEMLFFGKSTIAIDENNKIYVWGLISGKNKPLCITTNIEDSLLYNKNIDQIMLAAGNYLFIKDDKGKIYRWNDIGSECLNDEFEIIADKKIDKIYFFTKSTYIFESNKKYYGVNSGIQICLNDEFDLFKNNMEIIIQYIGGVISKDHKLYQLDFKYEKNEMEFICLTDEPKSVMYKEKIFKYQSLIAITESNNIYIYFPKIGTQ